MDESKYLVLKLAINCLETTKVDDALIQPIRNKADLIWEGFNDQDREGITSGRVKLVKIIELEPPCVSPRIEVPVGKIENMQISLNSKSGG